MAGIVSNENVFAPFRVIHDRIVGTVKYPPTLCAQLGSLYLHVCDKQHVPQMYEFSGLLQA